MSSPGPRQHILDRWTYNRLLLIIGFGFLIPATLLLSGGGLSLLLFPVIFVLPAAVFIVLVLRRDRPWTYLAAGIATSILPILTLSFGITALLNPEDGPTFAGAMFAFLALVFAFPSGVQAFRKGRQGVSQPLAREALRTRKALGALVVASVCAGAIVTSAIAYAKALSENSGYDFVPDASIQILARDFAFQPRTFVIASGTLTEIVVVNGDSTYHTFTYVDPQSGQTRSHGVLSSTTARFLVVFTQPHAAPIRFWCIPHAYSGMDGNFTIT